MSATTTSKRAVFRTIAEHPNYYWPYYRLPDTEYIATDLGAFEHDAHRLASAWFKHDVHDDIEAFICGCPLHHLDFTLHDTHPAWHAQSKPVVPMVCALMLMDLHGWEHETAFVEFLDERPDIVDALGFENAPDQSTVRRARHERFSDEFLRAITECVVSIRVLAGENDVSIPTRNTSSIENDLTPLEESNALLCSGSCSSGGSV